MDAITQARLIELAEEHEVEKDIRDAADRRCDEIKAEVGFLLTANGIAKDRIGEWGFGLSEGNRPSISKERLLELGVSTDIIKAATKDSKFPVVNIRRGKAAEG